YYVEGNPRAVVSPDCYVVFGVGNQLRDCYKVWEEMGRMPNVVFEFTSKSTRKEDTGKKFQIYERSLKVKEYFLFDPTGDYLSPILQGYRLVDGRYVALPLEHERLFSELLKLELVLQEGTLRFFDPGKSEWLLTTDEQKLRADTEAQRAEAETLRADAESQA